jgi:hypothetical protein
LTQLRFLAIHALVIPTLAADAATDVQRHPLCQPSDVPCRALVTVGTLAAAHCAETAFLLIRFPWQAFDMSEQTRRRRDFRLLIIGEILLGIGLVTGALL